MLIYIIANIHVEGVVAADPCVENLYFWVIFRDNVMEDEYEEFLSYAEAAGNANLGNMTVSWFFNFLVLRSDPISRRPFFLANP